MYTNNVRDWCFRLKDFTKKKAYGFIKSISRPRFFLSIIAILLSTILVFVFVLFWYQGKLGAVKETLKNGLLKCLNGLELIFDYGLAKLPDGPILFRGELTVFLIVLFVALSILLLMRKPKRTREEKDKEIFGAAEDVEKTETLLEEIFLKIGSIGSDLQGLKKEVESIKYDLQTEKTRIDANIRRITEIGDDFGEIKGDFQNIRQQVNDLEAKIDPSSVKKKQPVPPPDDKEEETVTPIPPIPLTFQQKVDDKVDRLRSYLSEGGFDDLLKSREWKDFSKSTHGLGTREYLEVNEANDVALFYRAFYEEMLKRNPNDENTFEAFKKTVYDLNLSLDVKIGRFARLGDKNDPEKKFNAQKYENIEYVKSKKHIIDAINKKIESHGEKLSNYRGHVVYLTKPTIVIGNHIFEGEVIVV
ncbi:MAG: hypothetical protein JW984_04485 [Deltaproteobacteria bacterium]|uniref:Uncharacterized protein n=1 Tax=Candidatus Zymogenus saltonus TaxID=2844893 RepID=A0A9D8KBP3_9DELT|nr:hypothetical protein [Candidatus Zymogenus saltonus]